MNETERIRLEEFRQFKKESGIDGVFTGRHRRGQRKAPCLSGTVTEPFFHRLVFENNPEGFGNLLVQAETMKVQHGFKRVVFAIEPTAN